MWRVIAVRWPPRVATPSIGRPLMIDSRVSGWGRALRLQRPSAKGWCSRAPISISGRLGILTSKPLPSVGGFARQQAAASAAARMPRAAVHLPSNPLSMVRGRGGWLGHWLSYQWPPGEVSTRPVGPPNVLPAGPGEHLPRSSAKSGRPAFCSEPPLVVAPSSGPRRS